MEVIYARYTKSNRCVIQEAHGPQRSPEKTTQIN